VKDKSKEKEEGINEANKEKQSVNKPRFSYCSKLTHGRRKLILHVACQRAESGLGEQRPLPSIRTAG